MTGFWFIWQLVWVFIWALRLLMAAGIMLAASLLIWIIWRWVKWLMKS